MPMPLAPLRLTGATILRDRTLQQRTVGLSAGHFATGPFPAVDLTGYYVFPGIIDMHATSPAPERAGVTTAWQPVAWPMAVTKPRLGPDLRTMLRYDPYLQNDDDQLLTAVRKHNIDYVVFTNGFLHADQITNELRAAHAQRHQVPRRLCRLAEAFDALGVIYGSHADPDGETRETFSMLGAKICEWPGGYPAASVANAVGNPVILNAAEMLAGDNGPVSALTLLQRKKCSALTSGGDATSLTRAAFMLADQLAMPITEAWELISSRPARIMRLPDRGEIAPGKRADLTIIRQDTQQVEATICAGRLCYLGGMAVERFAATEHGCPTAAE